MALSLEKARTVPTRLLVGDGGGGSTDSWFRCCGSEGRVSSLRFQRVTHDAPRSEERSMTFVSKAI